MTASQVLLSAGVLILIGASCTPRHSAASLSRPEVLYRRSRDYRGQRLYVVDVAKAERRATRALTTKKEAMMASSAV